MEIVFTKQAVKDFEEIKAKPVLLKKVRALLTLIEANPFTTPPSYEKLIGLDSVYSRRINIQHRLVFQVYESAKTIKIISLYHFFCTF